ncbi:MAG: hypothetical protein JO265_13020, partial [Acidimicrobiia bacterium]|nr:hypothetical protein [Acidimicrobiia bacterium]
MYLVRPRLLRRLERAPRHPVTLITAPAGSGKTVLVDQWTANRPGPPVAKVTVGPGDDWPGAAAQINARLPAAGDAILMIDAVDGSSDQRLEEELAALLGRAPTTLRFVLVSRSRLVPMFDALPAATGIATLGAADLAFTPSETHELVRRVAGLTLSDSQLEVLQSRTEGLAAGVEVAAVGLRDAADPDEYLASFAGDERHLAAYLADEVLARQSPATRRFLVRTSVLDRLNGSLCDAVTRTTHCAVTLRRLERAGLFVRRLPGSREWFTYHRLFRDVLRRELRRGEYGSEAVLHVEAGEWWQAHDDPAAAAGHFVAAEDWPRLVAL